MGHTITFEVNFMDSNIIPWFLSLNNFMIPNVFMTFSAIFCIFNTKWCWAKGCLHYNWYNCWTGHQCDLDYQICCQGSPLFSRKEGAIKNIKKQLSMQCISFLGLFEEMMQRGSCGRVTNLNAHESLCGQIIVMAQNYSWKMSFLMWYIYILFHSLGPLSSALSAADSLLRNTNEAAPHQHYTIMDFEAVDKV